MVLLGKLVGSWLEAVDVPLDQLVSCSQLDVWRDIFDTPDRLLRLRGIYTCHGVFSPPVYPQTDGSIGVALPWVHPDQTEVRAASAGEQMVVRWAYVVLDDEPDSWRVRNLP